MLISSRSPQSPSSSLSELLCVLPNKSL
jgi:hypothetical protein